MFTLPDGRGIDGGQFPVVTACRTVRHQPLLVKKMSLAPLALALAAALSPAAEDDTLRTLDAVVVVGSRSAEPVKQVVGAVSRIDREAMERRGVQGIEDLARL